MTSDITASLARLDEWKAERERTKFMTRPRLRGYLHELARGYLPQHNIQWYVGHNDMGHRTGYVRVPKGHPWFGKSDEALPDIDVHGGVTYTDKGPPGLIPKFSYGWWIGFDCAHWDDAPDPDLMPPRYRNFVLTTPGMEEGSTMLEMLSRHGTVKSQEYVEAECINLCMQAVEAARGVEHATSA